MDVSGPDNVSHAVRQAETASGQFSHQSGHFGLGIENQLPGASDIASARNYFSPKIDVQAMAAPISGIEHSSTVAMKAAEQAISPMLQIIMRLPGHVGIFSSFLECLKGFFMPHDLLSNFNPVGIVSGADLSHATGLTHLGHSLPSLNHAQTMDLSMVSSTTHGFHTLSSEFINSTSSANLHINPFQAWKQSMNVSSGMDVNNPQFEGLPSSAAHQASSIPGQISGQGDNLAGPAISAQAIVPKLSPDQRIFSGKFLEFPGNSHSTANTLLAANNQSGASGITGSATSVISSSTPSNLTTVSPSVNSSHTFAKPIVEHSTTHDTSGLVAKALSLNDVLHKGHMPLNGAPKQVANNPFSKLASNSKIAFHTAQIDKPLAVSGTSHAKSADIVSQSTHQANHKIFSHSESASNINTAITSHAQGSLSDHYTVKPGDNLWKISKNIFGSGEKWTQLYKMNDGVIGSNPSMIFSGQKLAISGYDANLLHPHPHVQHIEQLAHHSQPNAPTTAHVHEQAIVHHEPTPVATVAQTPTSHINPLNHANPVKHASPAIAEAKVAAPIATVAHNPVSQVSAASHSNPVHSNPINPVNHNSPVSHNPVIAAAKVPSAPVQQAHFQGLAVEKVPDQILSGSGGAQAATTGSAEIHKAAGQAIVNKAKSVVSFSLTPDLSFLEGNK